MRTHIDPPLAQWRLGPVPDTDRRELAPLVQPTGGDTAKLEPAQPILATGHQPWLWHPGILAKDIATVIGARKLGAAPLHIVVDHDVLDPLRVDVPVIEDARLRVETLKLGEANPTLPTCVQPAVDLNTAINVLHEAHERWGDALAADVQPLIDAIAMDADNTHASLGAQVAAWTARLMWPYCGDVPFVPASALLQTPPGRRMVEAMLHDAANCARRYNDAVAHSPQAGVPPLVVERERVELPLWCIQWNTPRQRVFADLADSTPMLTLEDGTPIEDDSRWLAPRALSLTALMRSALCEMFVHGTGGGIYDRIAEQWWQAWRGETLAPMAVATADAHLAFDAPTARRDDVARALWYRHHAPYNADRLLDLNGPAVTQKHALLRRMNTTRDRFHRWLLFRELRRFNDELCRAHPELLEEADRRLRTARLGLTNQRIAAKRDWCFALYPAQTLQALCDAIEQSTAVCAGK